MARIPYGVKPDIFNRAPNYGWGNFSTFWASSSARKVRLTAEKVGRPKIDENFGWGKTRTSFRGRPKKGQKSIWGKPDIFNITNVFDESGF